MLKYVQQKLVFIIKTLLNFKQFLITFDSLYSLYPAFSQHNVESK